MECKNISQTKKLNNGMEIPILGFGTYLLEPQKSEECVATAIENGYKLIDTAYIYQNEVEVGQGIKNSGANRKDLFITTKVWNNSQGYEKTLKAFDESIKKLKVDYLDMYMVHWVVGDSYLETYKALEYLYNQKLIKNIGVCNFEPYHLDQIFKNFETKPVINQCEYHILFNQKVLRDYCTKNSIVFQGWGLLRHKNDDIETIAKKYNKSYANILTRWAIQNDITILLKSSNKERIIENTKVCDFEISEDDMNILNSLDKNLRMGPDPYAMESIPLKAWTNIVSLFGKDKILEDLSKKYNKIPTNLILKWAVERNIFEKPNLQDGDRIITNMLDYEFEISQEDLNLIDTLNLKI